MTIWEQLGECVETLSEPFSAQEILSWFRRHIPTDKESYVRAHVGMCSGESADLVVVSPHYR